ncbi:hypothetical protein HYV72_01725 [Candidatus Uhrbacteria bacterium]|nr:hypothetical protein [Candidatus Uhrbacteria bacterium]
MSRGATYIIEKKPSVEAFKDQQLWRNGRHTVTDARREDGQTRYFVFAKNPALDDGVYENFLSSVEILPTR